MNYLKSAFFQGGWCERLGLFLASRCTCVLYLAHEFSNRTGSTHIETLLFTCVHFCEVLALAFFICLFYNFILVVEFIVSPVIQIICQC